jgi:putative PIN family toxin of toxin-antitoxin system
MRITIDTNVLISIAVFDSGTLGGMLDDICLRHTLILSTYVLEELSAVVKRKFPDKIAAVDNFLMKLPFETEFTPHTLPEHNLFVIRDKMDEKVLYAAITADADILITGDKDFFSIEIERPEIVTPSEFLERY